MPVFKPVVAPLEVVIWAAGFFDGEGWVGVSKQQRSGRTQFQHELRVAIGQNDKRPLVELQAIWGGALNYLPSRRVNQNPHWAWRLNGRRAADFLTAIRPYLRVKGEVADVGLRFATTLAMYGSGFARPHLSAEQVALRDLCRAELTELNRVGWAA